MTVPTLMLLPNQPTDEDCDEMAKAMQAMIAKADAEEEARLARLARIKAKKEQEQNKNEPTQQEKPSSG